MLYVLKVFEFIIVLGYIAALSGAYLSNRDSGFPSKLDKIELAMASFLALSGFIHIINLFR